MKSDINFFSPSAQLSPPRRPLFRYLIIYNWMVNNWEMGYDALLVYALLYGYTKVNPQGYGGSLRRIAFELRINELRLLKIIKRLQKKQLVFCTRHVYCGRLMPYYSAPGFLET